MYDCCNFPLISMFLHPRGEKECHLLNHFSPSIHYIFAQMNQLVRSLSALSINDAKVLVRSFASKKSEKIEAKKEKEMAAKKRAKLQMMGKGSSGKPVTGKKKEKEANVNPKELQRLLQFVFPKGEKPAPLSPEKQKEYAAIAKEYSSKTMKLHHQQSQRLQQKIVLMHLAIDALPTPELRKAASKPDYSLFPPMNLLPSCTPPAASSDHEFTW